MKYVAWLVLFLIIIGMLVFLSSDELDQAGFTSSNGHIESGAKFGIYIGMPVSDARQRLVSRGLSPDDLTIESHFVPPQSCLHRVYGPDRHVEAWSDDSWRRGTICLTSTQGKITSVAWRFNPVETW